MADVDFSLPLPAPPDWYSRPCGISVDSSLPLPAQPEWISSSVMIPCRLLPTRFQIEVLRLMKRSCDRTTDRKEEC
eukprot:6482820-Amphidinium_carterae.2